MEYCFHALAGAPSCYFDILDKLQKWICRTIGPSLAASCSLSKCSQLKSSYGSYFGRCSTELAELVPLPHSRGRSTMLNATLLNVITMSMLTVSFLEELDFEFIWLQNTFL